MPTVDLLCLAYSMKHGGRCVAGIRLDTHEWVRPVSDAEDGTLTVSACRLDVGRQIQMLDVVRIPLREPRPAPHQPENWVVGDRRWQFVRAENVGVIRETLDELAEQGPRLLGSRGPSVAWHAIERDGLGTSLSIVRASPPRFIVNDRRRLRARFNHGGVDYDLSCTAIAEWASEAHRVGGFEPTRDWYLVVSLGEPWGENNRCYKLVAGAVEAR